jgi:hypothetical protein
MTSMAYEESWDGAVSVRAFFHLSVGHEKPSFLAGRYGPWHFYQVFWQLPCGVRRCELLAEHSALVKDSKVEHDHVYS